jgi:hypothetical protein
MRSLVVLLLALFAVAHAQTPTESNKKEVWRWVDGNGVVHYSDRQVPGATLVDVNVQAVDIPTSRAPRSSSRRQSQSASYDSIAIATPKNDEAIWGSGGKLTVSISLQPGLQGSDSVRVELDGQVISQPNSRQLNYTLNDVERGTHTLSASVVTTKGEVLLTSEPSIFHMRLPTAR